MTETSARPLLPPDRANIFALLFGIGAAPACWIAQLVAGYTASDFLCYRSDHPALAPYAGTVGTMLFAFDVVALAGALAGAIVSFLCWRSVRPGSAAGATLGRSQFLAIWGIFSSLWFFGAIAFSSIGTAMVPICLR